MIEDVRPLDVECSRCGAGAHASCRAASGRRATAHRERKRLAEAHTIDLQAKATEAKTLVSSIAMAGVDLGTLEVARDAVRELRFDAAVESVVDTRSQVALLVESLRVVAAVLGKLSGRPTLQIMDVDDVPGLSAALLAQGAEVGTPYGVLQLVRNYGGERTYYAASLELGALGISLYGRSLVVGQKKVA